MIFFGQKTKCDKPDTLSCTLSLSALTLAKRSKLTTRWNPTNPTSGSPTFTLILTSRGAFFTLLYPCYPTGSQMSPHITPVSSHHIRALESPSMAASQVGRPPITGGSCTKVYLAHTAHLTRSTTIGHHRVASRHNLKLFLEVSKAGLNLFAWGVYV